MPDACPNPACRSREVETLLEQGKDYEVAGTRGRFTFRLAGCRACGLAFVDPRPGPDILGAFYASDYAYWVSPAAALSPSIRLKYLLAGWRHGPLVGQSIQASVKSAVSRMVESAAGRDVSFSSGIPVGLSRQSRVLDYGFGTGEFLLGLRALGFTDLWGYDVASNSGTRDRLVAAGIRALVGSEFGQLPPGSFDCIRLEHVLEHLSDPVTTLSELRTRLRPGGLLVVSVPSIHAWEPLSGLAGSPYLEYLQLPIHLWHHSSRSLRDFLVAAGLDVAAVRTLRPHTYLSALARNPAP